MQNYREIFTVQEIRSMDGNAHAICNRGLRDLSSAVIDTSRLYAWPAILDLSIRFATLFMRVLFIFLIFFSSLGFEGSIDVYVIR